MPTILVPLDGSTLAAGVLPVVEQVATLLDARIWLLHVAPLEHGCDHEHHWTQEGLAQALDGLAKRLRADSFRVTTELRLGAPAPVIREVAEHLTAALVALSVNGWGGVEREVVGRVAEAVLRCTPAPLLLIHSAALGATPWRLRRMLVVLAAGVAGQQALHVALHLARASGAALLLVRTVASEGLVECSVGGVATAALSAVTSQLEAAGAEVAALAERLRREGVNATPLVLPGDPAALTAATAADYEADLVVLPTHGCEPAHDGRRRNVADEVLHTTDVPVLLVRADGFG